MSSDAAADRQPLVAGLVLAAGASRRFGEAKQLARVGAETLLERTVRVAAEAGLRPVLVVLGSEAERIRASSRLGATELLLNPQWVEGMGSTLRVGVTALAGREEIAGVVVMTCDMPLVTANHLRLLAGGQHEPLASGYAGRAGVPAYLPRTSFAQAMTAHGDAGARAMLAGARTIELADGDLDVDTPEQLQHAHERLRDA